MAIKRFELGILLVVLILSGWQVWNLTSTRKPAVLAETTTKTLEERVKLLETRVYILEKNAGLVATVAKKSTETFVSLVGGEASSADWTKIPGTDFTFDGSLYGKTIEVSWQGWLEGTGSVRIYDSTNHRAVDFSEFTSTGREKRSFYSKAMSIWRGQNQYSLEGKIADGVLTLSNPRLKILVK
jgi:hypothetical protein